MIKYIPVLFILAYLTYVDLKKREVPQFGVITLFLYSFFITEDLRESTKTGLLVFALLFIAYLIFYGSIGGGDVKLLAVLAFMLGVDFFSMIFFMFPLLLIAVIYNVIKYKNIWFHIPLVPYISLAFLIWFVNGSII